MARQVIPILGAAAGAVAGFALGGPAGAIYGAQGGFLIGTTVGNIIDPTVIQGNTIGDQTIQTASEGGARAIVYAKGCVTATCVIARGNRQVIKTQTRNGNGKGASSVTENQSVHWTFAIGIGEDLIGGSIRRIWQDETLVYDVRSSDKQISDADNTAYAKKFRFYDGSETQLPDPDLQTFLGDDTPCYRGTAYVVFPNFDLTPTSERIPQFKFEVVKASLVKEWQTSEQVLSVGLPYPPAASDGENLLIGHNSSEIVVAANISQAITSDFESVIAQGIDPREIASNGEAFVIISRTGVPWVYRAGDTAPTQHSFGAEPFSAYALASRPGQWMSLGRLSTGLQWYSARSSTGADWILSRTDFPFYIRAIDALTWDAPSGKWLLKAGSLLYASLDTVTWRLQEVGDSLPGLYTASTCSANGGTYSLMSDRHRIAYSTNGIDWHLYANVDLELDALCYSDEYGLCAVPVDGVAIAGITESGYSFIPISVHHDRGACRIFAFGDRLLLMGTSRGVTRIVLAYKHLVSGSPVATVGGALEALADRVQVDLDASAMTETCDGVVIQETTTGADAISSIAAPFFANAVEVDGKLKMVRRGAAVQRVLTYDDLTEEPEVNSRENSIEYPEKLHFFYQSPTTGYATTKATSSRYSANALSSGESSVTAPVVFDSADGPVNIASKLHKVMWAEAEGTFTWKVGDHNLDLVPSDCVGLYLRGIYTRARITQIDYDIGKMTLTMVKDRQSAYSANVTAMPLPTPTAPPVATMSKAVLAVLDIPALFDTDDGMCYYLAMSGSSQVWAGGVVQRSMDGGSSWANVASFTTDSTMGRLTQPLPAASPDVPDMTNSLTVQLFDNRNELLSVEQQAWLAEQNGIAVQCADGSWEIMQYETAVDAGNGLYTLSGLQRGRLGTPGAAHAVGALFVLLGGAMVKLDSQTSWIGQTVKHRGVSYTTSVEDADVVDIVYSGLSQRELPVAGFDAEMQGTVLNISNIVPRMRFGTEDTPVVSANWEGYRIVATGASGALQADTVSTGVQLDCATIGQVASVAVSQLNRLTGAGPAVTKEIQ